VATFFIRLLESRFFVLGCFTVFLVTRVCLVFFIPIEQTSDGAWYLNSALGIASGKGYSEGGYPTAFWPVGYPGFLGVIFWLFGKHEILGQIANIILATASLFLVMKLAKYLFRSEITARLAMVLITVYPNNAAYTPLLFTEIYFTFLLLFGTYLFIFRRGWFSVLATGFIFGLAALTKPQIVLLPGFLVILSLFEYEERQNARKYFVKGLIIYITMAALLTPWAIRNTLIFGETVLISTNGGVTLLTGNNPSADGGYVEDDPLVAQRNFSVRDQVAADRRAKDLAVQWIKENPARFVELIPLKIWQLWFKDGEAEWFYQRGFPSYEKYWYLFRSVRIINQVYYSLLIVGLIISVVLLKKQKNGLSWPLVLFGYGFIIYLTLISVVFSGQSRFHFPAMPWIVMYTAWVVTQLIKPLQPKQLTDDDPKV
jgi:4-amino-4-deoxy-L-arabinose transferase-like glycosyltransferase